MNSNQAQAFLLAFGVIYDQFHLKKHALKSNIGRNQQALRFDAWVQLIGRELSIFGFSVPADRTPDFKLIMPKR